MTLPDSKLERELIQAAMAVWKRGIAKRLAVEGYLAFLVPGERTEVTVIFADAGKGPNLIVYRFPERLAATAAPEGPFDFEQLPAGTEWLRLCLVPLHRISPEDRQLLDRGGFTGRRTDLAPQLWREAPHVPHRLASEADCRTILYILRTLLDADDVGELDPDVLFAEDALYLFELTGEPFAPEFTRRNVVEETDDDSDDEDEDDDDLDEEDEGNEEISDEDLATAIEILGDHDTEVEPLLVGWQIPDPSQPISFLLILSAENARSLGVETVMAVTPSKALWKLIAFCNGDGGDDFLGRPKRITFTSRPLYDFATKWFATEGLEIPCEFAPQHVAVDIAWRQLTDAAEMSANGDLPVPANDDLVGWQAIAVLLKQREYQDPATEGVLSADVLQRYFDDAALAREALEDLDANWPSPRTMAAVHWVIHYFRRKPTAKTPAETVRANAETTKGERALSRAIASADVAIYRVESIDGRGSIELKDIRTDQQVTIHSPALTAAKPHGLLLCGKVIPVGAHHLFLEFGPRFPASAAPAVIAFLDGLGAGPKLSRLKEMPHHLGRLFAHQDEFKG